MASHSSVEGIAGFSAGVLTALITHPLEIVKTRLQLDSSAQIRRHGSIHAAYKVIRSEGSTRALYRGLTANVLGSSTAWALYFLWRLDHGMYQSDMVIKTRMLSSGRHAPGAYTSLIDGGRQILRKEGLAGFYRGTLAGLFGTLQGAGQFTLYEEFKSRQLRRHRARGQTRPKMSSLEALWTSGLAKVLSTVATYPYQVVRARLQSYDADKRYRRMRDVIDVTWRREGLRGFYKGLGPSLARVLPSTWVTFLVYENVRYYMS